MSNYSRFNSNKVEIQVSAEELRDNGDGTYSHSFIFNDVVITELFTGHNQGVFYYKLAASNKVFMFEAGHNCRICGCSIVKSPAANVINVIKVWAPFPDETYQMYRCHDCDAVTSRVLPSHTFLNFMYSVLYNVSLDAGKKRFQDKFSGFLSSELLSGNTCEIGGGSGTLGSICEKYVNIDYDLTADIRKHVLAFTEDDFKKIGKVDQIVCCDVIEHMAHPYAIFSFARDVLPKGKLLYLNVGQMHTKNQEKFLMQTAHLFSFSRKTIEVMASKDFNIIWEGRGENNGSFVLERK